MSIDLSNAGRALLDRRSFLGGSLAIKRAAQAMREQVK